MRETKCILCQDPQAQRWELARIGDEEYDVPAYRCPLCGPFVVGGFLEDDLNADNSGMRFRIACVFREYRLKGESGVFGIFPNETAIEPDGIFSSIARVWRMDDLLREFPKASQLVDRSLLNLARLVQHPMDPIDSQRADLPFLLFCPPQNLEVQVNFMLLSDFLRKHSSSPGVVGYHITPGAWSRIDELATPGAESRQAFVAMWFDPSVDGFYENGLKLGIADAGFEPQIISSKQHNNKICDEIIAEIRRSRFVVADFTGQRGGVYFEAGFAMGLGLPVIWVIQKDDVKNLHFDTRQYNHIVYTDAEDLRKQLHNRIAATIH